MECAVHPAPRHPLARYCYECGASVGCATNDAEVHTQEFDHLPSSLCATEGTVSVCCEEGLIQSFDHTLRKLNAVSAAPQLASDATPAAIDGYLYLPTRKGVSVVDLIAASFQDSVPFEAVSGPAISPISAAGDCAIAIVSSDADTRLVIWRNGYIDSEIAIPKVEAPTFAPVVRGAHAYVAVPRRSQVYVIHLSRKIINVADVGGPVCYSAATRSGMAVLVRTKFGTRVMAIDASTSRVMIPALPEEATWFRAADAVQGWVWGDGSRMVVHGMNGVRTVQVAGNVGVAWIDGRRAIAVTQTASHSALVTVDLSTALVRTHQILGSYSYSQFVLCRDRVIASSGRSLQSVAIGAHL